MEAVEVLGGLGFAIPYCHFLALGWDGIVFCSQDLFNTKGAGDVAMMGLTIRVYH